MSDKRETPSKHFKLSPGRSALFQALHGEC